MPEGFAVLEDAGLIEWHVSPAIRLDYGDGERRLIELRDPQALEDLPKALDEGQGKGFDPRTAVGGEPGEWWAGEESGAAERLQSMMGESLRDPKPALARLAKKAAQVPGVKDILSAPRGNGLSPPGTVICDIAGKQVESSRDYLLSLLRPQSVVMGAALATLLSGCTRLVFYIPLNDRTSRRVIGEHADRLLAGAALDVCIFEGPVHVPASYEIGREAIVSGAMLWEAASSAASRASASVPAIVLPAASALSLSRTLLDEDGRLPSGMVNGAGKHSLAVPGDGWAEQDRVKAVQADFRLFPSATAGKESMEGVSQAVLLGPSQSMVEWSRYLAKRAEDACCGGCTAGRTAPAAAAGLIDEIMAGNGDSARLELLDSILARAGGLALCPRLGEVLGPVSAALRHFREEFESSALRSASPADSSLGSASTSTEER
jgi:hypothetical protein